MGKKKSQDQAVADYMAANEQAGGTAPGLTDEPAEKRTKSKFNGYYLVIGIGSSQQREVVNLLPTVGQARKWVKNSEILLARMYVSLEILRCKPVPLVNPNGETRSTRRPKDQQ